MRLALLALLFLAACDTFFPPAFPRCEDGDVDLGAGVDAPVWHEDVRPIVEARCARCHVAGGVAPFSLATYDDARAHADAMKSAVVARRMPPWSQARCCRDYAHDPSLTDAQVATLARWVDDGAPAGDPAVVGDPLPRAGGLPRVDVEVAMDAPYLPAPASGKDDDFRCFVLPWEEPTRFVTGFDLIPGDPTQAHHAILFVAGPDERAHWDELDDADEGPGWSCPGGFLFGVGAHIGGWGPGRAGHVMPEGHGQEVPEGGAILLAMHYARHDGDFVEDKTTIDLMVEDDVDATLRSAWIYNAWWPYKTMSIPRGASDVRHAVQVDATDWYSAGAPITVFSAAFHMHQHGTSGMLAVRRADGTEECLLQIDDWDPDWQEDVDFVEPVVLNHGDQIMIECRFDNSAGDVDLNWAEDGEMCIAFLTVLGDAR